MNHHIVTYVLYQVFKNYVNYLLINITSNQRLQTHERFRGLFKGKIIFENND